MKIISKKSLIFILPILLLCIYLVYTGFFSKNSNTQNTDIYKKYYEYIQVEYDEKAPKDEFVLSMLEDVSDIVKTYDRDTLSEIIPTTELPEIDLKETKTYTYDIDGKENIDIKYVKPENYSTPLSMIYLSGEVFYKEKKVTDIQIRESGDFKGEMSLHIYNNTQLKYPVLVIGEEVIASYRDEKGIFFLIDGELIRYKIKYDDETLKDTFGSTLDIDIYMDEKPYIYSYWEDPAFIGLKITKWSINYEEKQIEREFSIVETDSI